MNPNITVIVPCYNGFKDMANCLNALENQTYKKFKVIVVDDCSTDDSYERLLDYQSKTQLDLKIVRNEVNKKLAKTRQVGVAHTETEWLCFCDCDDWYEYDFLEKMLKTAEDEAADCVMCHANYAYTDGTKEYLTRLDILSNDSSKEEFIAYAPMSIWRYVFKKNLFKDLIVPAINNAEDGAVTPQLLLNSKKIAIIHEGLYNYYVHNGTLSTVINPGIYSDFCKAQEVLDSTIGLLLKEECEFLAIKNFGYGAILNGLKAGISIKKIRKDYMDFLQKYPKWYLNKYIYSLGSKKRIWLKLLNGKQFFLLKCFAKLHTLGIKFMTHK